MSIVFRRHFALTALFLLSGLFSTKAHAQTPFQLKTVSFSLTFNGFWSVTPAIGSAATYQSDSTAVAFKNGGLNGMAVMGLFPNSQHLESGVLPGALATMTQGAKLTKVKDSTALYGLYTFYISDYTYDSLSSGTTGSITLPSKGKFRLYATQVGSYVFTVALLSAVSSAAILPYADVAEALKTLVITPKGVAVYSLRRGHATPALRTQGAGLRMHGAAWGALQGLGFSDLLGRRF